MQKKCEFFAFNAADAEFSAPFALLAEFFKAKLAKTNNRKGLQKNVLPIFCGMFKVCVKNIAANFNFEFLSETRLLHYPRRNKLLNADEIKFLGN